MPTFAEALIAWYADRRNIEGLTAAGTSQRGLITPLPPILSVAGIIYRAFELTTGQTRYVGKTKRSLQRRIKEHRGTMRRLNGSCAFSHLGKMMSPDDLGWEVVEIQADDSCSLSRLENRWIEHYRQLGCDLINRTKGCNGALGFPRGPNSDEHNSKVSEGVKAAMQRPEVREAFLKATVQNAEWLENASLKKRGDLNPAKRAEVRAKISANNKSGTAEVRAKISATLKRRNEERRRAASK